MVEAGEKVLWWGYQAMVGLYPEVLNIVAWSCTQDLQKKNYPSSCKIKLIQQYLLNSGLKQLESIYSRFPRWIKNELKKVGEIKNVENICVVC